MSMLASAPENVPRGLVAVTAPKGIAAATASVDRQQTQTDDDYTSSYGPSGGWFHEVNVPWTIVSPGIGVAKCTNNYFVTGFISALQS